MSFEVIIILLALVVGFAIMMGSLWYGLRHWQQTDLEKLVESVFGRSAQHIAEQSKLILEGEKDVIANDLANKHKSLEELVARLQKDLQERQNEIRGLEQDRIKKFGQLSETIENQRQLTDQLAASTKQLAEVLSNNQARGEWGERIIEDLLKANGLVEGVHYARQRTMHNSKFRPDITLLLPNKRVVAVDVKFPYAEIQKWVQTDSKSVQRTHLQQFKSDLKIKIDKVAEYINPASDTLDYAIIFVPNEMVFSFVNQKLPDMVDYAMSKRVLMVSPFTFLIVARTVMESYRNFMVSDSLRAAAASIESFIDQWDKFQAEFLKYGRTIDTLQADFEQIAGTRVRQMNKTVSKVKDHTSGAVLPAVKKETIKAIDS